MAKACMEVKGWLFHLLSFCQPYTNVMPDIEVLDDPP